MLNGSLFSSRLGSVNISLDKNSPGKSFFTDPNSNGPTSGGFDSRPSSGLNNTSFFGPTDSDSTGSSNLSHGSSHRIATIEQPIMSDFQRFDKSSSSVNNMQFSPLAPPTKKQSPSRSPGQQARFSPYRSAWSRKSVIDNGEEEVDQSSKSGIRHSMSMDFRSYSRLHTNNLSPSRRNMGASTRHINQLVIRDPSQDSPLAKTRPIASPSALPSPSLVNLKKAEPKRSAIEDGYWIFPPFSKLSRYSPDQLTAVTNLMVGRRGHGQITFIGPVDLSKLSNLGDILGGLVVIDNRMVCVYPDESSKAPEGTELNVPAIVSLENCAPRDKKLDEIITEPSNPIIQLHISRLSDSLRERGGDHLTYDINKGTWVFKVPHFSRWGGGEFEYEPEESFSGGMNEIIEDEGRMDGNLIDINETDVNIDDTFAHKMVRNVSKIAQPSNFFATPNFDYNDILTPDVAEERAEDRFVPEELNDDHYLMDEDDELPDIDDLQPPELGETPLSGDMSEDSAEIVSSAHKSDATTWNEQLVQSAFLNKGSVEIEKVNLADLNKILYEGADMITETDTYTYMSAAKQLRLPDISSNFPIGHFSPGTDLIVVRNTEKNSGMALISPGYKTDDNKSIEALKELRNRSTIVNARSGNAMPLVEKSTNISFAELTQHFSSEEGTDESELWQLASILFDDVHQIGLTDFLENLSEKIRTKIIERHRKRLLSTWLEEYVKDSVNADLKNCKDDLEKVYILLTGHQISQATDLAVKSGNIHLATVIPLIGSEDAFMRSTARSQIQDWIESGSIDYISDSIVKIFELASGECTVSKARNLRLADDLDWKRSFGLRLWYGGLVGDGISKVLDLYSDYLDDLENIKIKHQRDASETDIMYRLLNVYKWKSEVHVKAVLDLSCQKWGVDYRTPWFIYSLLPQEYLPKSLRNTGDGLSADYGLQLLSMGHWIDAIFVLSHIQRDDIAQTHICRALAQHAEKIHDNEKGQEYLQILTETLHVARNTIFELDALRLRWKGDHTEEIWSLLQADMWEEAHQTLITRVAPRAVIEEDTESLLEILRDFKHSVISSWKVGGGMYYNFAELIRLSSGMEGTQPTDQISTIVRSLVESLSNVPITKTGNPEILVAVSIMSAYVFSTALKYTNIGGSQLLQMKMSKNDYFRYTLDLSVQYFQNKA